jgi:hypothetical protein
MTKRDASPNKLRSLSVTQLAAVTGGEESLALMKMGEKHKDTKATESQMVAAT